jgi:hypothetical protein
MTLPVLRRVQQGRAASILGLATLGVIVLVLLAPAEDRRSRESQGPIVSQASATHPGAYPLLAGSSITCIPTSAHSKGAVGTNWRTDMEVHNPGATQAAYTVALLKHAENNSNPASQSFTLGPGQSIRYDDVILGRFAFNGKAALRITATAGSIVVTSRTYNDQPTGTFGQFVPAFPDDQAITSSEEGRLIQLSHQPNVANGGYRTNLGMVNAGSAPIGITIDLYTSSGTYLGRVYQTLRAYEYVQVDKVFERVTANPVVDGYAVIRTSTSGGRFFAYASVIDNRTSDPIFIPAAKLPKGGPPPTPTPTATPPSGTTIGGPGGTSIVLPSGGRSPNTSVAITTADGSALAKTGETIVSTVIGVSVGGERVIAGSGPFIVKIPVTGTVGNTEKLLLKVQTSVGHVYPVAGVYDSTSRLFSAELDRLWDGWRMGVVTSASLRVYASSPPGNVDAHLLGWVTPEDWQTCSWRPFVHTNAASAAFIGDVRQALDKACDHLRSAQFRSPRLWIDQRSGSKARAVHIVSGLANTDPSTHFGATSADANPAFSVANFNDDQMLSLGQLYVNVDQWQQKIAPFGISLGNVLIHELLHAVQRGYDIRDIWWQDAGNVSHHPLMYMLDGTATVVGQTYQENVNGIYGGEVAVRKLNDLPEQLDEAVQWDCCKKGYARQDYFAYVAKRYNDGSFRDLRLLFQHFADQTDGQFNKSAVEYKTIYRRAMDFHVRNAFSSTLPEIYTDFVVDRAYRHTEPALLRPDDRALPKNSLDSSLFSKLTAWDPGAKTGVTAAADGPGDLEPLQAWAIRVSVPEAARTAGTLSFQAQVTGASFGRDGVRIFVFREKDRIMVTNGEMEVTDISKPVTVPVNADIATLTILVANGSVERNVAKVALGSQLYTRLSLGKTEYTLLCATPPCQGWCGFKTEGDPKFVSPLTWSGNVFSYSQSGALMQGELSADGKTVLYFRYGYGATTFFHWVNVPLVPARSTSNLSIFAVSGGAAHDHIVTVGTAFCFIDPERWGGIDWSQPVAIEVWLGR